MHNSGSITVYPSQLLGVIDLPRSKSQALRAIVFAAFADGVSCLHHLPDTSDVRNMLAAVNQLGATVRHHPSGYVEITGLADRQIRSDQTIDVGNSGIALRFLTAVCALYPVKTIITGDRSICLRRPMGILNQALETLGAKVDYLIKEGFAPFQISGGLSQNTANLDGLDSQPVSALLLMASLRTGEVTKINVSNPAEQDWVDLTLHWLVDLGVKIETNHPNQYRVFCRKEAWPAFEKYVVPSDLSALAFWLVGALVTQSELHIRGIDFNEPQGDLKILDVVRHMGAKLIEDRAEQTLTILSAGCLKGGIFDLNSMIDALPALMVLACYAEGRTRFVGVAGARHKESNRLEGFAEQLRLMGAQILVEADHVEVLPVALQGAEVYSNRDHRVAMALSIAALAADGPSTIHWIDCIQKTDPEFYTRLEQAGGHYARAS